MLPLQIFRMCDNHRMAWVGSGLKLTWFQPSAVGNAATHQMKLPKAPYNPALKPPGMGHST